MPETTAETTDRTITKGDHLYHEPSGDYLGVARGPASSGGVVRFDGPRTRGDLPVTLATIHEVAVGEAPAKDPARYD